MFKKKLLALLLAAGMLTIPFAVSCEKTPPDDNDDPGQHLPDDKDPDDKDPDDKEPDDGGQEEDVYALTLPARYLLATAEGAKTVDADAALTRNGEAFDGEIAYTVADTGIASVSDGTLTAITAGKTTLTATYTPEKGEPVTATAAVEVLAETTAKAVNDFEEESLNLLGRTYFTQKHFQLDNPCTGFEVAFFGTELSVKFYRGDGRVAVYLDGSEESVLLDVTKDTTLKVAEGLEEGIHVVRLIKAMGPSFGNLQLETSPISTDGVFLTAPERPELKIEFVGDSITAGIGASGTPSESSPTVQNSNCTNSYAYLTAQNLGADYSIVALSGICAKFLPSTASVCMYDKYTKGGMNGGGDYDFTQFDADFVVLALGENDMWLATSHPDYSVELFRKDYADMLRLIREKRPNAHIVCIYGMMGASSTTEAEQTITGAIEDTGDENISHVKMTQNVAGAHLHPSAAAHKQTAKKLTKHIQSYLN